MIKINFNESKLRTVISNNLRKQCSLKINKTQAIALTKSMLLTSISYANRSRSGRVPTVIYFRDDNNDFLAAFILRWNRKTQQFEAKIDYSKNCRYDFPETTKYRNATDESFIYEARLQCKALGLPLHKRNDIIKAYNCVLTSIYHYIKSISRIENVELDVCDIATVRWNYIKEASYSYISFKINDFDAVVEKYNL